MKQTAHSNDDEHAALSKVLEALKDVDDNSRQRILRAVATFYEVEPARLDAFVFGAPADRARQRTERNSAELPSREPTFSGHPDLSPKQFIEEKQPRSDIERVACLAYYLAHFRDTPHFRTVDISKLNTEAAQFKFSNAALAVNNAAWRGLLTTAGKGTKQISALGERYVAALPDRESAKKVLAQLRVRRKRASSRAKRNRAAENKR